VARKIKIGVQLAPENTTYAQFRDAWLYADSIGADSIWNWDHFFVIRGSRTDPNLEGWTTLAMLAAQTKHALNGCLVLGMSFRNPALLSKMATMLDIATGGRSILGLGSGWFEPDYSEYGYEFGTAIERLRNLERGIQIIQQRWQIDEPKPPKGKVPILIGGSGEKVTLRLTAQYADYWNGYLPLDVYRQKNRVLDEWCQKLGRDPAAIERTAVILQKDLPDLDGFVEAGATHLIYRMWAPFDFAPIERLLRWRDSHT
jgi:probable F420-dependent oxidoreductase